jgi:RNA polymerase sigma factor (sigma-70 family)
MTPIVSTALLRTQSDARLLALASQGHERAFEAIVERYRAPLHRYCRRILPEARTEDVVQQAFLNAWSALGSGVEVEDLKAWLYRIARNAALDNARRAGYDYAELTESLRLAPGADSDVERRAVIRETLAGVASLPPGQRDALLRTAAGHSRADIARDLDVSEGAVRQLVHRARTTLRAAATALTPSPLVSWAAALGASEGAPVSQRIAELAVAGGSAGIAATAVKAGTVVVAAGVIAAGPGGELRREVAPADAPAASRSAGDAGEPAGAATANRTNRERGRSGGDAGDERRGRGRGERSGRREGEDRRDSSGPGSGREDDDRSGRSGPDHDSSGSDPSGSGSDSSGSGSGSDSSGSGSDSSGSGSGSGSGTSGGDSGGDSSGSGSAWSSSGGGDSSGSGSSGSGSGEDSSGSGSSGSDDG